MWRCEPCKIAIPVLQQDKIRTHLRTKKHHRLRNACPNCSSLRMKDIEGECWDSDGIRSAEKCMRCLTEYKCYAHGKEEKDFDEYTGEVPERVIPQQYLDDKKLLRDAENVLTWEVPKDADPLMFAHFQRFAQAIVRLLKP
jgi:hypothetical protein